MSSEPARDVCPRCETTDKGQFHGNHCDGCGWCVARTIVIPDEPTRDGIDVGNADHEDLVLINALLRSELARLRAECEAAKKERQESINHMNSVFEQWVKMGEERDAERARADAAEAKLAPIIKLAKRLMRSLDGHGSDGLPLILDVNHFSSTPAIFTLADCKRLAAEGSK